MEQETKTDNELLMNSSKLTEFFDTVAGLTTFSLQFFKNVFVPPFEFEEIKKHMVELGIKTLPIVTVTGFIIGLVLTLQSQPVLKTVWCGVFSAGHGFFFCY